jgi:uncharacterized protein
MYRTLCFAAVATVFAVTPGPTSSHANMSTATMAEPTAQAAANDRRIDYIEFPATDIAATKRFYIDAFGLAGGFTKEGKVAKGGPLVVLFAVDLVATEARVKKAGGKIVKPIFAFPGGKRFHFMDPSGNELAVWSTE